MLEKIKNILLYAGMDKETYNQVIPDINRVNRSLIIVYTGIGTALVGLMCIVSVLFDSMAQNRMVYSLGFIGVFLLFLCAFFYSKKYPWLVLILVYIAYALFYTYGIFIGTVTNPTQQTVTFMVMLVFMSVLFIDRPVRSASVTFAFIVLFIILCVKRKTGDVLTTDILDAIIYGILGSVSGGIITHIKIRSFVLEHKLQEASRIDQLTQMNNRNSFETDLLEQPGKCRRNLSCIYIDVNGLHELNNSKGHMYGDIMLQYVAEKLREVFGSEMTYRIGGDEFVAFAIDMDNEQLELKIRKLNEAVEKEGYHLAIGYKCMDKEKIVMKEMINSAENLMYQSKMVYYQNNNIACRVRSESV